MTPVRVAQLVRPRLWAVLLVMAVLAGCTDGDGGATPSPTPTPADQAQSPDAEDEFAPDFDDAVAMGEPVTAERFELRVDGYGCDDQVEATDLASDETAEPDEGEGAGSDQLCQLTMEARNDTDTEQSVDTGAIVLLDEFATEYAATEVLGDEQAIAALPPGESTTVVLMYVLPAEATIVAARLRDDVEAEGQLVDLADGGV